MNRWPQAHWLLIICAAGPLTIARPAAGGGTNNAAAPVESRPALNPPLPPGYSPVDLFRRLLAMSPQERDQYLANRPPDIRKRISDKVREYLALDPDERELRLRATELHWFLLPLLREPPATRDAQLAQVPEDLRDLVKSRLLQWEILPPPMQQEFLDNERALSYFADVNATNVSPEGGKNAPSEDEWARWKGLSNNDRRIITAQFNEFFTLTPDERQQTLNTLSDAERAQMDKSLQSFSALSADQRIECIRAFTEFTEMSPQDRAEFLKNAQRWSQLSPKERQAWRDLVAEVPKWPPLPPGLLITPIPPPKLPPQTSRTTN
ncbi:MAG TPA: DUF3106 domain-containing protein [Verrucomicrobiae bacterium]|nr:DUF3106 domain-containing protein [Verrucomicrobiae bacterium]